MRNRQFILSWIIYPEWNVISNFVFMDNKSIPISGFLSGVLCTQFVNSALHIAQPLLMAEITGSYGHAAFFSSFDTAVHMAGTFFGGWPVDRFGARNVLIVSTFLRGLALAAIPFALLSGMPSAIWAMSWYTLDAFIRGFTDASVFTLPMEFGKHETAILDRFNSRFEFVFDLGGISGPLVLGGLMKWFPAFVAHSMIPIGFFLSSLAYFFIPNVRHHAVKQTLKSSGSLVGLKTIFRHKFLLLSCIGYMSFNIYPLRKLLSAFFAKALLHQAALSGTIGSAFGLGGLLGTLVYSRFRNLKNETWIKAGAAGMIVLALGWSPGNLWIMCLAAFLFAATNAGARLSLTRLRQTFTPVDQAGGVTAASRFGANLVSVLLKALVGAAFTIGAGAYSAFAIVGCFLALIALFQIWLARKIDSKSAHSHQ